MIVLEMTGNILVSECEVIVIPTNCVGVMGAGLAKMARLKWPEVYAQYRQLYHTGDLLIDKPIVVPTNGSEKHVLLFPTKDHWRHPSDRHWVINNLKWIQENYDNGVMRGFNSLAIPPVGCGFGLLNFDDIKPEIYKYLDPIALEVHLYVPNH